MLPQASAGAGRDTCGRSQSHVTEPSIDPSNLAPRPHPGTELPDTEPAPRSTQSYPEIAGVKNELMMRPNLNDLPTEILCNIFDTVIHNATPDTIRDLAVDKVILAFYFRLGCLISVCSHWRGICLSTASFWSLIPILRNWKGAKTPMDVCLERAGDSELHLVGEVQLLDSRIIKLVAQHGSRIRTLDISGARHDVVRNIVASVLVHSASGRLANFSVRDYQTCYRRHRFELSRNLFSPDSSECALFSRFASSLRVLRLCGFSLDWSQVRFSGLVELRLEEIALEDEIMAANLLFAVASAPRLCSLQLLKLEVRHSIAHKGQSNQLTSLPVSLWKLQSLFLRDIHKDLLSFLLRSINPGCYRTFVGFTEPSSFFSRSPNFRSDWDNILQITALELKDFNINTLMISGNWLSGPDFHDILRAVPTITSLLIRGHLFDKTALRALIRPPKLTINEDNGAFPTILRLHILDAEFDFTALDELKEVVNSHGVQEMSIGGLLAPRPSFRGEGMIRFEDPADDLHTNPIRDWLRATVPNFVVARRMADISESEFWIDTW
ncbi:unnamed protein product [Rhizoctonia solani]|uniref:F-box domain-containing protein n=1 Tax=Rhizoctonia solani TaxID=456999 RepID=A0A8H3BMK3_9AGAM|nr:unnamed protein product [Rhizoctonia solani]